MCKTARRQCAFVHEHCREIHDCFSIVSTVLEVLKFFNASRGNSMRTIRGGETESTLRGAQAYAHDDSTGESKKMKNA